MAFQETARAAPAIAGSDPRIDERFGRRLDETNITSREHEEAANRLRFQFLTGRLHALGPAPLAHFLDELERGADLRQLLEIYAALPVDLIRHYRGDQFATALYCIDGGQS
jgi:hypothetical protein